MKDKLAHQKRVIFYKLKPISFDYLETLNQEIESNDLICRQNAYETLHQLNDENLNPGLVMRIKYLQGKYHYLNFKTNNSFEAIEKSMGYYRDVFIVARVRKVNVNDPKYYFKYGETLLIYSQHVFCLFEQNRLLNKAYSLVVNASKRNPNNSSLKWLKNHILQSL